MDDIIARLRKRHADSIKKFKVPALSDITSDGGPFVFYARAWTVADSDALASHFKDDTKQIGAVHVLVRKALDEDGNKLFRPDAIKALSEHVESEVLANLAVELTSHRGVRDGDG